MICPVCSNPLLVGEPPNICSPLRCDAWVTRAQYDHASKTWIQVSASIAEIEIYANQASS